MGRYKVHNSYLYTETVYYDESGVEVGREVNDDAIYYDSSGALPLEGREGEDYYND